MNRLVISLLIAFAATSTCFRVPSYLPNRFTSKRPYRENVAPQFLARDYKGSLSNYPITLDTPTLPMRRNYGPHVLAAVLAVLAARNFEFLKDLVLQAPTFLKDSFRSSGSRQWSLDFRKLFSRAKVNTGWNKCILQSKSELTEKYIRYRFQVPSDVSSSMSQVQLCSGDNKKNAVVDSHCCLNYPSEGYFDIIDEIRPDSYETNVLSKIVDGDEVAFRAQDAKLKLTSSQKSFFILTVGLGIMPTLQVLNQILTQSQADIYMVWANGNKNDFIFNQFVRAIESAFPQRLTVSRLVDESVDNEQSASYSERLKKCVLSYELGRVGTIFAPARELQKAKKVLRDLNYPDNTVLACDA